MNLKNFLKTLLTLAVFTVLVSSSSLAQTTYYVNNQTGLDGYNGLSATVTGTPGEGPKLTISNAVSAASDGDIISVANTGNAYTALNTVVNSVHKNLTFVSTGGTPVVNDITIQDNTTFTGPFALAGTGTLTLTAAVTNASNLTINDGGTISRGASGTLDVAPAFAGSASLTYTADATTGPELPTSTSVLKDLTVTGAITVTVNASATMSGTLTVDNAGGTLKLQTNTLTINNTTAAKNHDITGAVTASGSGGITTSTTTGTVTFINGGTLPSLTSSATTGGVVVNGPVAISGSVVDNGGTLTLTTPTGASGITGSVTNNGTGTLTIGAAVTIGGNVANNSTGIVAVNNVNVTINGNVSNAGALSNTSNTAQVSGKGNINFGTGAITIGGKLTNSVTFSGTTSGTAANAGGFLNSGNINFAATANAISITGLVTNSSSSSFTLTGTTPSATILSNNGNITIASTTGNLTFTGGVVNSSSGFSFAGTVENGAIYASALTSGTITSGGIANNSSNSKGANGDIDFMSTATGTITITGNVSLDNSAGEGDIIFGAGTTTISGSVSNARTDSDGEIVFNATANNVTVGSLSQTGAGSITFASTTGTITDSGAMTISAGTVSTLSTTGAITITNDFTQSGGKFDASALTTGTVSFSGSLSLSSGTLDLTASGGSNITVTNNFSFTGGTLKLGAGTRNFTVTGANATIAAGTSITGGAATTLLFNRGTSGQVLTSGVGVVWPGLLNVNDTFPTKPTFSLEGGNFKVTGDVTFSGGGATDGVNLNTFTLFVGGNFTNNSGYYGGSTGGFVSMQGAGAQTVAGSAKFSNIEVDNAAGATFSDGTGGAVTYTITGTFNLTNGSVAVGAGPDVIAFNNSTNPPTIVRNSGSFGVAPTFTSKVNVAYIGGDKAFSNEVPTAAGKLVNLTIATTGSATVTANVNFDFSGVLTINSGQTFAIGTQVVTSNGTQIVSNGSWTATTGYVDLTRTAGTAITATGALPEIRVATGSSGNTISGSTGITVGTNPNLTLAAGPATIQVAFTGNGPHVGNIVTNDSKDTVWLASNVIASGNLSHAGGLLSLGANTLTVKGTAPSITGGATVTGTGKLVFNEAANTALTVAGSDATIAADVEVSLGASGTTFTVGTNNLILSGNTTLTKGTVTLNKNLKLTGKTLTLTSNSSVVGAGILDFAPATDSTLTVTLAGATSFTNVTVDGNVTLTGASGDLTLNNGALVHNKGVLNFGSRNINLTGNTTFNRTSTSATYDATTGYLVYNSTGTFTQGTSFSIPNLKVSSNLAVVSDKDFTVINNLYLNNATLDQKPGTTARLSVGVASGSVPTITVATAGDLDSAPAAFAQGMVNYDFAGGTVTVDNNQYYWPTTTTLANNVTVSGGTADFVKNRQINGNVDLNGGDLKVEQNITVTVASGATISRTELGSLTLVAAGGGNAAGALSAPSVDLTYYTDQTSSQAIADGAELSAPTVVNNLLVKKYANLTIGTTARTISGTATFNETTVINKNTTVDGNISVATGKTLTIGATVTAMANVTMNGTASTGGAGTLSFGGAVAQTFTMGQNTNINGLTIAQSVDSTVTVTGGNLTVGTSLTLTRGLLVLSGSNTLTLSGAGQGYTRGGTYASHVVGNVTKSIAAAVGRYEFPVGSMTQYRPAAFTFATAPIFTFNLTVGEVDQNPAGTVGLPIVNGISTGHNIGTYPDFYWLIKSSANLGSAIKFNLELTAGGFTDYSDVADLRIIRRVDGDTTGNAWSLQGTDYDNYIANGVPTVTNINSVGGINPAASRFTYGLASPAVGSVSGTVTYNNTAATPMKNVTVTLNPGGMTTTTDSTGAYSFNNVANGDYTVTASSSHAWLGANATDAYVVSQYFNGTTTLSGVKVTAADVNKNGAANNTDALLIVRRFAGLDSTFAAGNWAFGSSSVTVNGAAVTANLKGLAMGDVNASDDASTLKQQASVSLASDGSLKVNNLHSFEVPVTISGAAELGAFSLKFNYPSNLVKFEGVTSPANGLVVKDNNGEVSIAWVDMTGGKQALNLKDGEALVNFKFQPLDAFKSGSKFSLDIDGNSSELTQKDGTVLGGASLKSAAVENTLPTTFSLKQNYPNPFNPSTTIEYDLPVAATVHLVVYNILGEQVSTLVNQAQNAGTYKFNWNANNMASGIYIYRINVEAGSQKFTQTHRMMLLK